MSEELKSTEIGISRSRRPRKKDFPASVGEVVLSGRLKQPRHAPVLYGKRPCSSAREHGKTRPDGLYEPQLPCALRRAAAARSACARIMRREKLLLLDEPYPGWIRW
jgi:zinc transport system ATP-binding protein